MDTSALNPGPHPSTTVPDPACPTCRGRGYVVLMGDDPEDGAEAVPCWNCGDVYTQPPAQEHVTREVIPA